MIEGFLGRSHQHISDTVNGTALPDNLRPDTLLYYN